MAEGPRIFKKESDLTSATLRVTRTMLVPAIKTFPIFTLLSVPLRPQDGRSYSWCGGSGAEE